MKLSRYFAGVAAKHLSATEVDPATSRGHEFQGIRPLKEFLGSGADKRVFGTTYLWVTDDEEPVRLDSTATWYDARANQTHRSPELRLYYPKEAEELVRKVGAGDIIFVCLRTTGDLLIILCPGGSGIEQQLLWLFGLQVSEGDFQPRRILEASEPEIGFAARFILDLIEVEVVSEDDDALDRLLKEFGPTFPTTARFSAFARRLAGEVDVIAAPDDALMKWIDLEERLFLTFEKHLVEERLKRGFVDNGLVDVESFVSFSLSVQNRRKSRAGYSLEHHLSEVFVTHGLPFSRGAQTEGKKKPDFLFPGAVAYHDPGFPADRLTLLGSKSSCKDRWRQVLAEGARVDDKHLVTLEPGISLAQTNEMQSARLQLVVPQGLHGTYSSIQRNWLFDLERFIQEVQAKQLS